MKLKKRKKSSRLRGSRTAGYGFRQKHKGHGNKGGFGWAGTGKRADHKKQKALFMANKAGVKDYFGRRGFTSRKNEKKINNVINLEDIQKKFYLADKEKIDLKDFKILGQGEGFKATIEALSASKSAMAKMEKAGGKIIIKEIFVREVKPIIVKEKEVKKTGGVEKKEKAAKKGKKDVQKKPKEITKKKAL